MPVKRAKSLATPCASYARYLNTVALITPGVKEELYLNLFFASIKKPSHKNETAIISNKL
jgi:hypothetical protein